MTSDIYQDRIYQAVGSDDFDAMIAVERYGQRNGQFDHLISRTHDHFWDPLDSRYLDYGVPFDLDKNPVLPWSLFPEFRSPLIEAQNSATKISLANENARWMMSAILHGEQAALLICSQLSNRLIDPGAQEYVANQAREEARHVTAFSRYISARWGKPYPVGNALGSLLRDLVQTPHIFKKLIGMQILVEGLAMGLFAVIHAMSNDPLLKRITQLVMTDETFHHKFGKTWAQKTIPYVSEKEHAMVEDWAAYCFEKLFLNLNHIGQRQEVYTQFGLDYEMLLDSLETHVGTQAAKDRLQQQGNIFRALLANLIRSNIVTSRTRPIYARWLDVDQVAQELDPLDAIGALIAQQGGAYLKEINDQRRSMKTK